MDRQGKSGLVVLLVVVSAIILYISVRLLNENDESRVRRVVYSGVVGVEKSDIFRCASIISDDYSDQYSNSKVALLEVIEGIFSDYSDLKVDIKQLQIKVEGKKAEADVAFVCYFKISGKKQIYYDKGKLKISFQKFEDKHWQVYSVDYSGSKDILFLQGVA